MMELLALNAKRDHLNVNDSHVISTFLANCH